MHQADLGDSIALPAITDGTGVKIAAPSRRSVITALATVSAAASFAIRADACAPSNGVADMNMYSSFSVKDLRVGLWDALAQEYQSAKEAADRHQAEVYEVAWAKIRQRVGQVPNLDFEIIAAGQIVRKRVYPADFHAYDNVANEDIRQKVAHIRDEWNGYCARQEQAEIDLDWRDVEGVQGRLDEIVSAIEDRLMACPSPRFEALAFKVLMAMDNDRLWEEAHPILVADAKRLLGAAT